MNPDNYKGNGDNGETQEREVIKMMRKERNQIKKEMKRDERQKEEERKKLALKFGPRDNSVRIISRELASKLIDSHKPQIYPQHLQLTPDDFPSLGEIVHRSQNVHFTHDINCSNFENRVTNEQRISSGIDLNVSTRATESTARPTETESINFTDDINFKDFENITDPNDINLPALSELDITKPNVGTIVNTEKRGKRRRRGCRGARSRKNRKPRRPKKLSEIASSNLFAFEECNLSESEFLNVSEPKESTLSECIDLTLSETEELNFYEIEGLNLSETEELNPFQAKETNLSGLRALHLSGPQELNLTRPNEVNVSQSQVFNTSAVEELNPPENKQINLTEPNEPSVKKKRVNFGPVTVNILDVLQKPKEKQKKVKVREINVKQYEGNKLDASQPERKRGKQREVPKEKKPSKLKQWIRRDIEELNAEEMNDIQRYTQLHIDYSKNVITAELDNAVTAFLSNIVRFQENMYERDPIKACARRRYVVGFRMVRKVLLLKEAKILIVAPDIKAKRRGDTLDTTISNLVSLAAVSEIPYVFTLCRRKIGRLTLKPVPISCVAVMNCDGTEKELETVLELLKIAREEYQKTKPTPVDPLTQEIMDNFLSFI